MFNIFSKLIVFTTFFSFLSFFLTTEEINPKRRDIPVIVCEDHNTVGLKAAQIFIEEVKKACVDGYRLVFILPTGSSPLPMYQEIVKYWETKNLDLSNIITINMDEYYGIAKTNDQSYHDFMEKNFHGLLSCELTDEKLKRFGLKKIEDPKLDLIRQKILKEPTNCLACLDEQELNVLKQLLPSIEQFNKRLSKDELLRKKRV